MSEKLYQICTKCVMDTTNNPDIEFDEKGVCNFCRRYDEFVRTSVPSSEERRRRLEAIIKEIKEWGKNREYDCIIGLSGGVDSSYLAYKLKEFGIRPFAVHFDSGWNSEISVKNIENTVRNSDIDLHTYVVDWEVMRDLQLAYLRASVLNCDMPQDYSFYSALYQMAVKKKLKYNITSYNHQTEFALALPLTWTTQRDLRNLLAIHKKFGTIPLKNYPIIHPLKELYYKFVKVKKVRLLEYLDFNKAEAMEILQEKVGWRYYGGKHCESLWTRFFQCYYLPRKFNIDKRKGHLSNLIWSNQMTREEALEELKKDIYPMGLFESDKEFVLKKLEISEDEFERIMALPIRKHEDFDHGDYWYIKPIRKLYEFYKKL